MFQPRDAALSTGERIASSSLRALPMWQKGQSEGDKRGVAMTLNSGREEEKGEGKAAIYQLGIVMRLETFALTVPSITRS